MLLAASAAVLVLALAFAVISSGHDVSNAIAMPVRHRALTARTALVMAAVLNVLGVALVALLVPPLLTTGGRGLHDVAAGTRTVTI